MVDGSSHLWRRLFVVFLVAVTALRLTYLGWFCPLDLAQDEAHYWDWSRNLDWSYYSKGPLVAWLIRLSMELFGPLSLEWTGSEMPALRLPAVVCGSLLLVALYILSVQTLHSERTAFGVALLTSTMPMFSASSLLMTIDSPYVCCWSWALVAGHRAITRNERWAWAATGLMLGLGILAKYTMSLWLFSFCLFLQFSPTYRHLLFRTNFWIMVGVAFACSSPIIGWNAEHGWVSFRHVAGQAGVTGEHRPKVFGVGLIEFLGGQFALLIGWWFIFWAAAMIHHRPTRETDPDLNYLWWMSLPTIVVFGATSLRNSGQVNWPVAAYVSGSVLMMAWLLNAFQSDRTWFRRLTKINVGAACAVGVAVTLIATNSGLIRTELAWLGRQFKPNDLFAVRKVDPTCRLRGWHWLAREIDVVRREVRDADGTEPTLAAFYWNMPGEIGFYCEGHPQVYSLGPFIGERFNQYDLWRPNPVADAQAFAGKTFIVVSGFKETLEIAFEDAQLVKGLIYRESDVPVASWTIWVCRGYRGVPPEQSARRDGY